MTITIDNLDGHGPIDYSSALVTTSTSTTRAPLEIVRALNQPSRCTGTLLLAGVIAPVRRARVVVTAQNGTVLFTGYIATTPMQEFAGTATTGSVYRTVFNAISDEWLLDRQTVSFSGSGLGQSGGLVLKALTNNVNATLLSTSGIGDGRTVGLFEPAAAESWSSNAGAIASSAYASYRVVNGAISLMTAGSTTHAFSDADGTLQPASLKTASIKDLTNDVTVSGAIEPAAYVTELFNGDGTTTAFQLTADPFIPKRPANSGGYLLNDSFNQGVFNPQLWSVFDAGSHLGFGANGLQLNGGNGFDGQTTLTALDPVEMGGTLLIEAGTLQLAAFSDGVLCGLYQGAVARANCFAGYNVRQSGGNTIVTPYLHGAEVGTSFTIQTGHSYTLRIRLHCAEMQRVLQSYYTMVEGAVEAFGGALIAAPMSAVFEVQDLGLSSNTPATVLYDSAVAGPIASTPATCTFAAVDSVQLFGSMGYCRITQTGSAWVVSTLPSGQPMTRLIGAAGEGVDCKTASTGKVTFFAGRVPVANEIVTVTYRTRQQAVARLEDAASIALEAEGGAPGTAAWLGKVLKPPTRSSADCEYAAQAILSFASSSSAALSGSYEVINPQQTADIWPGDVLALTTNGSTANVMVRTVTVAAANTTPEGLAYKIAFANDWAEALGMQLSDTIAPGALLPTTAATAPGNVLASLPQMTVVSATGTALQIDSGTLPPSGGGFEVRRRDGDFGPGVDQDLVLRSPVRSFSIPREGQVEQYFVRMYDGSTPPLYSRFSSAVFTNLPVD